MYLFSVTHALLYMYGSWSHTVWTIILRGPSARYGSKIALKPDDWRLSPRRNLMKKKVRNNNRYSQLARGHLKLFKLDDLQDKSVKNLKLMKST